MSSSWSFLLIKPVILGIFSSIAFNSAFVANPLILGILFSTVVNAVFVAKSVTLGTLPSISVVLVFLTRPLVSGILFFNFDLFVSYLVFKTNPLVSILFTLATNLSYAVFLTTSFFTTSLSLLKSTGTGANLSISSLSTSVF